MTRIESLTGLRFVAALAVFMSHVQAPEHLTDGPVAAFIKSGNSGVTLFFVLSGFVLAWTYEQRLASPDAGSIRDFAAARFARIMPLYWAALAFVLLLPGTVIPPGAWMHLLTLQTWSGSLDTAWGLNGPGWSVGIETFLYALCPLLLWLLIPLGVRRLLWVLAGAVLALTVLTAAVHASGGGALPWSDPHSALRWLYRTPLTRVPDFVIGMVLALVVMRSGQPNRWAPTVQWGCVAALVLLMSSERMVYSIVSWDLAYALIFAALIWSLASSADAPIARFLSTRLMVRGGVVSYAFYLFHAPMIDIVGMDPGLVRTWAMSAGASLVLALLVATGAHVAIEVPAQKWLRRRLSGGRRRGRVARTDDDLTSP